MRKNKEHMRFIYYIFLLLFILTFGCKSDINKEQIQSENLFAIQVESTTEDIAYQKYNSRLDTTKGLVKLDKNNNRIGIEPTFADRYFKKRQVDSSGTILINKAITAREIAKCLIFDKFGKAKLMSIDKFEIILVDNKFWCILFSLDKEAYGGTNLILISKYDGKLLEWTNLK